MSTRGLPALIGRVLLALMFLMAGYSKFGGLEGTAGYIASKGLPMPEVLAIGAAVLEFGAAALLIVGWQARWAALSLAAFTLVASLVFHNFWAVPAEQQMVQNQPDWLQELGAANLAASVPDTSAPPVPSNLRDEWRKRLTPPEPDVKAQPQTGSLSSEFAGLSLTQTEQLRLEKPSELESARDALPPEVPLHFTDRLDDVEAPESTTGVLSREMEQEAPSLANILIQKPVEEDALPDWLATMADEQGADLPTVDEMSADPLAWLRSEGVDIDDEAVRPTFLFDEATELEHSPTDPMAWMRDIGVEVIDDGDLPTAPSAPRQPIDEAFAFEETVGDPLAWTAAFGDIVADEPADRSEAPTQADSSFTWKLNPDALANAPDEDETLWESPSADDLFDFEAALNVAPASADPTMHAAEDTGADLDSLFDDLFAPAAQPAWEAPSAPALDHVATVVEEEDSFAWLQDETLLDGILDDKPSGAAPAPPAAEPNDFTPWNLDDLPVTETTPHFLETETIDWKLPDAYDDLLDDISEEADWLATDLLPAARADVPAQDSDIAILMNEGSLDGSGQKTSNAGYVQPALVEDADSEDEPERQDAETADRQAPMADLDSSEFDWLDELKGESDEKDESDWLDSMSFDQDKAGKANDPADEDVPDWLAALGPDYTQPETLTGFPSAEQPLENLPSDPSRRPEPNPFDGDEDSGDALEEFEWISGVEQAAVAASPASTIDPSDFEMDSEDEREDGDAAAVPAELPDWLSELQPPVASSSAPVQAVGGEQETTEPGFEWMGALEYDDEDAVATPPVPGAVADDDAWLDALEAPAVPSETGMPYASLLDEQQTAQDPVAGLNWMADLQPSQVDDLYDEDEEAEPEPAVQMPDWLQALEPSAAVQPPAMTPAAAAETEWADEFEDEDAAPAAEGVPDWLSALQPEQATEADEVAAEIAEPDWLGAIQPAAAQPVTPEAIASADWLTALDEEGDLEEAPVVAAAEIPDWMRALQPPVEGEAEFIASVEDTEEVEGMVVAAASVGANEEPDWLAEALEPAATIEETDAVTDAEPVLAKAVPDWLTALESEDDAESETIAEEPVLASADLTWLAEAESEEDEMIVAESDAFAEFEMEADELDAEALPVVAHVPAPNAPDWLNAMVPGVDLDYEATEEAPIEREFIDDGSSHRTREPVLETVLPARREGEFDWLTDIVEEETALAAPVAAPAAATVETFRAGRREPRFVFSKPPAWLRRLRETARPRNAMADWPDGDSN